MTKRMTFLATSVALLAATQVFACMTPLPWRIVSPAASPQEYFLNDIGASGEATDNVGYTLKVMDGILTIQSIGGTASNCAWGNTIPEPTGGWSNDDNYHNVDLELWSGGQLRDTVVIGVR